jgi:hypothetical protein
VWYLAGTAMACYWHSRRQVAQVAPASVVPGKKAEQTPSEARTPS